MRRADLLVVFAAISSASALAPGTWSIALNVGREEGSSMPPEWAASGGRFFLQTQVAFSDAAGDASDCAEINHLHRPV